MIRKLLIGGSIATLGGSLVLGVRVYRNHKDFTLSRAADARGLVRAHVGYAHPVSNEFFVVHGFLQGNTCYYRLDTTWQTVQSYTSRYNLVEVDPDSGGVRGFLSAPPYWWAPEKGTAVRYFGVKNGCIISWDEATGRCHIRRHGG